MHGRVRDPRPTLSSASPSVLHLLAIPDLFLCASTSCPSTLPPVSLLCSFIESSLQGPAIIGCFNSWYIGANVILRFSAFH